MVFRALKRRLGSLRHKYRASISNLRRSNHTGLPLVTFIFFTWLNYAVLYTQIAYLKIKIITGLVADPFPNVPVFLRIIVRRFRRYANQRDILYIRSAMAVAAYYINRHTLLGSQDSYLQIKAIPGTTIADATYGHRISLIAETLFCFAVVTGLQNFVGA